MLFVQGTSKSRLATTSLHNIAQCNKISVERHTEGKFRIKFYYGSGKETFQIVYPNEESAMNDFNSLMKSLEDHRFLWKCSAEGRT